MHGYVVTLPILHHVVLFAAPKFSFITLLYGSTEKIALRNGEGIPINHHWLHRSGYGFPW